MEVLAGEKLEFPADGFVFELDTPNFFAALPDLRGFFSR
jgi:hypothetical protein